MTRAFVAFWKLKHGCERCISLPGKSMCQRCLRVALKRWHIYVATRLAKKLCIQCPRKHKDGEQRCQSCADANRANCISYYHRKLKGKVARAVADGQCGICRARQAEPGRRNCQRCQKVANARNRGERRPKKTYLCLLAA